MGGHGSFQFKWCEIWYDLWRINVKGVDFNEIWSLVFFFTYFLTSCIYAGSYSNKWGRSSYTESEERSFFASIVVIMLCLGLKLDNNLRLWSLIRPPSSISIHNWTFISKISWQNWKLSTRASLFTNGRVHMWHDFARGLPLVVWRRSPKYVRFGKER